MFRADKIVVDDHEYCEREINNNNIITYYYIISKRRHQLCFIDAIIRTTIHLTTQYNNYQQWHTDV